MHCMHIYMSVFMYVAIHVRTKECRVRYVQYTIHDIAQYVFKQPCISRIFHSCMHKIILMYAHVHTI